MHKNVVTKYTMQGAVLDVIERVRVEVHIAPIHKYWLRGKCCA